MPTLTKMNPSLVNLRDANNNAQVLKPGSKRSLENLIAGQDHMKTLGFFRTAEKTDEREIVHRLRRCPDLPRRGKSPRSTLTRSESAEPSAVANLQSRS